MQDQGHILTRTHVCMHPRTQKHPLCLHTAQVFTVQQAARAQAGSRADSVSHTAFGESWSHCSLSEVGLLLRTCARTCTQTSASELDIIPRLCTFRCGNAHFRNDGSRFDMEWCPVLTHTVYWFSLLVGIVSHILNVMAAYFVSYKSRKQNVKDSVRHAHS